MISTAAAAVVFMTMTITVYVPRAGGINGGARTAAGVAPYMGVAACGPQFKFGTVFEILDNTAVGVDPPLPKVVVCLDRGRYVGNLNLDVALVSDDVRLDLQRARQWGKRQRRVAIYENVAAYRAAVSASTSERAE